MKFSDWKEKALQNTEVMKEYLRLGDEEIKSLKSTLAERGAELDERGAMALACQKAAREQKERADKAEKELQAAKAENYSLQSCLDMAEKLRVAAFKRNGEMQSWVKSLDSKLQSAKADSGRLVKVFKKWGLDDGHLIDCPHGDRLAGIPGEIIGGGCSENCQRVNEALSTSNALDYWTHRIAAECYALNRRLTEVLTHNSLLKSALEYAMVGIIKLHHGYETPKDWTTRKCRKKSGDALDFKNSNATKKPSLDDDDMAHDDV